MPNRILHERICVSETVALLSATEERFFYRLLVQCDDYGRFDARPSVIRARCFPLQLDDVSDGDVAGWLLQLVEVGLVTMYRVDGRSYLQVATWHRYQQTRAQASKYPDPPETVPAVASNGYQPPADVPVSGTRIRTPEFDTRESLLGSPTPTPPPQAGEGADPKPANQRRRGRSQGVTIAPPPHSTSSGQAPLEVPADLTPPTEADRALWDAARDQLTDGWLPANAAKTEAFVLLGRDPSGWLWIRAPAWAASVASQPQLAACLVNAGDPFGQGCVLVEG